MFHENQSSTFFMSLYCTIEPLILNTFQPGFRFTQPAIFQDAYRLCWDIPASTTMDLLGCNTFSEKTTCLPWNSKGGTLFTHTLLHKRRHTVKRRHTIHDPQTISLFSFILPSCFLITTTCSSAFPKLSHANHMTSYNMQQCFLVINISEVPP